MSMMRGTVGDGRTGVEGEGRGGKSSRKTLLALLLVTRALLLVARSYTSRLEAMTTSSKKL